LAFPPPSHRDATTPSPCWAPHFMTQERIMFSNPTPSEPRLSPAATMMVQVFAVGESTGDESTYCIVIQRMPTWNSRKSQSTTNCRSKTSVHKAFKEITAWLWSIVEFNEVNMMALETQVLNLASGKRWSDNQSIFWSTVISLTKASNTMCSTSRRVKNSTRWATSVIKSRVWHKNVDTCGKKSYSARSWQQRTWLYKYWTIS